MIGKLQSIFQDTDFLDKELVEDVIIELKQAFNTVNIYSDILTGTMDAFASIISNNVNAIMKRMTSLSITLMIPTLIASFYGMNVDIHLEEMPYAFALIILCSVVLSTLAFIVFRKNQVVLIQATAIQAVLNLPLRQRHKKAACHS